MAQNKSSIALRLILVIGLLAGCAALALTKQPRLGLDLAGGTQFVLQAESTPRAQANAANTDKAIEVLRGRVDSLGISEPTLTRSGENRIIVELPDVKNSTEAQRTLGRTAQLTVHPVVAVAQKGAKPSKKGDQVLKSTDSPEWLEVGPAVFDGAGVKSAAASNPEGIEWVVNLEFQGDAADKWKDVTAKAACAGAGSPQRRVAIVLDGKVISSAPMSPEVQCGVGIPNATQISGNFTQETATNLAVLIEGGALPLEIHQISSSYVGPTLGAEAITASWQAAAIGLVLTALFIGLVYRLFGFLATLALSSYALLAYAMLVGLGSTLTLPGLAGFVLAIGMAIDANVLVFERAREEFEARPSLGLRGSLAVGFNRAWTAIIDSNVTTLLAAGLLFFLGSGPIKGFGVTLVIGVVASMVSALIIARVLTEWAAQSRFVNKRPQISGLASIGRVRAWLERRNPQFLSHRKALLAGSCVALVIAVAGIVTQGLQLGVEFSGGRQLQFSTTTQVSADTARTAVSDAGFPEATVQRDDQGDIAVRVGEISDAQVRSIEQSLRTVDSGVNKTEDVEISASFGQELRDKALIAFGIAFLAQLLYLAVRFKWTFGLSAVLAMAHDVVLVVGLFAWLHKPIDGIFLAAVMTIIGLSVNDTVVTFDRIRERWYASRPQAGFLPEANTACIETLPRTINTGMGSMFILGALVLLGGDSLRDFSIALLTGLVVGTYSSIFMATPLVTLLNQRWPLGKVAKVKPQRKPGDTGAVV